MKHFCDVTASLDDCYSQIVVFDSRRAAPAEERCVSHEVPYYAAAGSHPFLREELDPCSSVFFRGLLNPCLSVFVRGLLDPCSSVFFRGLLNPCSSVFFRGLFRIMQRRQPICASLTDPDVVPEPQGCNRVNGWQIEACSFAGVKCRSRVRTGLLPSSWQLYRARLPSAKTRQLFSRAMNG